MSLFSVWCTYATTFVSSSFCGWTQEIMFFISLLLESLCLSVVNNEDLIYCTKVYLSLSLEAF